MLISYSNVKTRWLKVCKHVFNPRERWWDVYGSLFEWGSDLTVIRSTGAFGEPDGHLLIMRSPAALQIADRNHTAWLHAAEQACVEAARANRIWTESGRETYIGDQGVQVVVARGQYLVTCFRPDFGRSRSTDKDRVRHLVAKTSRRAGVRRLSRRASLQVTGDERPAPLDGLDT